MCRVSFWIVGDGVPDVPLFENVILNVEFNTQIVGDDAHIVPKNTYYVKYCYKKFNL